MHRYDPYFSDVKIKSLPNLDFFHSLFIVFIIFLPSFLIVLLVFLLNFNFLFLLRIHFGLKFASFLFGKEPFIGSIKIAVRIEFVVAIV